MILQDIDGPLRALLDPPQVVRGKPGQRARALQFEELALTAARKKDLGVILMKVTSQEKLVGTGPGRTDRSLGPCS